MLTFNASGKKILVTDQSTKDILRRGNFGYEKDGKMFLYPEEALYLMDIRNAECKSGGRSIEFNALAVRFANTKKFMTRYFTYKDWRDRGIIAKDSTFKYPETSGTPTKRYPSSSLILPRYKLSGIFFQKDLITVVDDNVKGKEIYEKFWFGQYGAYKAADRGRLNKLDIYEALFLIQNKLLSVKNINTKELVRHAVSRRGDFLKLYEVYRDWREKGYVVKTGFKFGTHFRIYFPGAKPVAASSGEWIHSKHVIHVFPKESKLLISEWARAIRVAHSVRKTFILAIPGRSREKKMGVDFILYHRNAGEVESPESVPPRYAMLSLNEEDYIGGKELAGAISDARNHRLELIIAIADRETAVTYYKVRKIELQKSSHEYYEIDWMQP